MKSDETDVESCGGKGFEALAFSLGCDSALCALVYGVSAESSAFGGDDGRAWDLCRSLDRAPFAIKLLPVQLLPVREKAFRRSKRKVGRSWRMDETYIKVKGEWKYLYRAVDKAGNTVDFLLRAHRDKAAARRFFEQAIERNDAPEKITIDKSGSNVAALEAMNVGRGTPIVVRQVKYLNNIVEQDHRAIKRRTRPMLGFKTFRSARILLSGIELMHMIRKGQMENGGSGQTPALLFYSLAA